jgi:hypothetical protein
MTCGTRSKVVERSRSSSLQHEPPIRLTFEIACRDHHHVDVSFSFTSIEFEAAQPIVEIIFGLREPEFDEHDFDSTL